MSSFLSKENYEEPACLLNMQPEKTSIPIRRVIEKLDSYLNHNDYSSAERHLKHWRTEAESVDDMRGKLTILNEQIGLYRKLGKKSEGLMAIGDALALADSLKLENTVTLGTTLINAATGYRAFEMAADAFPLYQKAQTIYESRLDAADARLGGLYNNMGLTVMELGDYHEAERLFDRALEVMSKQEHGEAEMAITYLNLADLTAAERGLEAGEKQICAYLNKAEELLNTDDLPRDGNYAFVCEKCAPVFGYYGYFFEEKQLRERARKIYEGP